jgi:hypothetical protein
VLAYASVARYVLRPKPKWTGIHAFPLNPIARAMLERWYRRCG